MYTLCAPLFCYGLTVLVWAVIAFNDPSLALLIDYANGAGVFNFGYVFIVYGIMVTTAAILTMLFNKLQPPRRRPTKMLACSMLFISLTMIVTALSETNWFVNYGHLPRLDALTRSHDKQSKCWTGVVRTDYNSIRLKQNCFEINEQLYCAQCRNEFYLDEPTFLKTYRLTFVMLLFNIIIYKCIIMYKIYKTQKLNANKQRTNIKSVDGESTSTYCRYDLDYDHDVNDSDYKKEDYYLMPPNRKPVPISSTFLPTPPPPPPTSPPLSSSSISNGLSFLNKV